MIPTKDRVTVVVAGELDDWGRPTAPTITEYSCRIDYRTEVVKTSNGEEAISRAVILIRGTAHVTTNDLLTWTDDFGEHKSKPLSVSPLKDLGSKVLFTKVVV